jgi:hypothetical protein
LAWPVTALSSVSPFALAVPAVISLGKRPGASALTRRPRSAEKESSCASIEVRWLAAALLLLYA